MASRLARIDEELANGGRTRAELEISVRLDLGLRPDGDPALAGAPPFHGTTAQLRAQVEAYRAVGVQEIVVSLSSGDVARQRATLETLANDVLPKAKDEAART